MSEHEFREAAAMIIEDACDGDRQDNFARMMTIEDMMELYEITQEESVA